MIMGKPAASVSKVKENSDGR